MSNITGFYDFGELKDLTPQDKFDNFYNNILHLKKIVGLLTNKICDLHFEIGSKYSFDDIKTGFFYQTLQTILRTTEYIEFLSLACEKDKFFSEYPPEEESFSENLDIGLGKLVSMQTDLIVKFMSIMEYSINKIIKSKENTVLHEYINKREKVIDSFNLIFNTLDSDIQEKLRSIKKIIKELPPLDSISRLVQGIFSKELISEEHFQIWNLLLKLRNSLVHNNGIFESNTEQQILPILILIEGFPVVIKKYEIAALSPLYSTFDGLIFLCFKIIDIFYEWLNNFELSISVV